MIYLVYCFLYLQPSAEAVFNINVLLFYVDRLPFEWTEMIPVVKVDAFLRGYQFFQNNR